MYWRYSLCERPEKRTVSKFAILPRLCEKGHKHWFETVNVNQRFIGASYSDVDHIYNYSPWGPNSRPCICPINTDG